MFDSIKKSIEQAGFGRKGIMKRYIKTFSDNNLEEGEELLEVASPYDKPTKLLFVTDKKVCFYNMIKSGDEEDKKLSYKNITSCEIVLDQELADIHIYTDNHTITLPKAPEKTAEQVKTTIDKRIQEEL
ncbi:PH domain-containing protein [Sediminibacillus massiliensis]|uniref:PH domain-containing protein n=1 Tax=Sediminibacillus massiliensis TaxID=1926277 RepID=UPI000988313A|nr:PH domain-containing protein [Sediminibacillus massiliensis]